MSDDWRLLESDLALTSFLFPRLCEGPWIWKQFCLLSDQRKWNIYASGESLGKANHPEFFCLLHDGRCSKEAGQGQMKVVRRLRSSQEAGQGTGPHVEEVKVHETTSRGQAENAKHNGEEYAIPLLDEDDFTTPLKFFSLSVCSEVDYSSDFQQGDVMGSPSSLQLALAGPLSFNRDLSACVALLKNSPAEARTKSPLNCVGVEESMVSEHDAEERRKAEDFVPDKPLEEGTSHAQNNQGATQEPPTDAGKKKACHCGC